MRARGPVRAGPREVALVVLLAVLWVAIVRPGPLSLPYFWDEADVYVPGSIWVAEHGLNITPGVFPDDYSRGHPPLLYLLAGAVFSLFGPSPTVGHLIVLPFTVAALVGTYVLGAQHGGRWVGAASLLALACTPLFMTMGNMLLPEMPLTALTVWAFVAFGRGRLLTAALLGVALVWTKETGVFTPLALACGLGWQAIRAGTLRHRDSWRRLGITLLPLLALLLFFAWQKATAGYFVFPHHQDLLWDRPLGLSDVSTVFPSALLWHGRWILSLGGLLGGALWFIRGAREPTEAPAPWAPTHGAVAIAALALLLGNAFFFTKMFWLERYALPAHPGVIVFSLVLLAWGLSTLGERLPTRGVMAWSIAASALGLVAMYGPAGADEEEHTFAYADLLRTHQRAFALLEAADPPGVVLTTWPMTIELENPTLGLVSRPIDALHIDHLHEHPDTLIGAIIVSPSASKAAALRELAQGRAVIHVQVGQAQPLELYLP